MANDVSNHMKYELADAFFGSGTFKAILLGASFPGFDKDTHENYDDVSSYELANGNGYTTGGQTLANVSIVENDTNDRADVSWDDAVWTASGGSIGPSPGAIIIKDSGTPSTSPVVSFIDFNGDKTVTDGQQLKITSPGTQVS